MLSGVFPSSHIVQRHVFLRHAESFKALEKLMLTILLTKIEFTKVGKNIEEPAMPA